jgi:hypothetical protein
VEYYPRGYPMDQRFVDPRPVYRSEIQTRKVVVNGGLWLDDPDVDAITRLCNSISAVRCGRTRYPPPALLVSALQTVAAQVPDLCAPRSYTREESFTMANGTWCPFNSQNTALAREVPPRRTRAHPPAPPPRPQPAHPTSRRSSPRTASPRASGATTTSGRPLSCCASRTTSTTRSCSAFRSSSRRTSPPLFPPNLFPPKAGGPPSASVRRITPHPRVWLPARHAGSQPAQLLQRPHGPSHRPPPAAPCWVLRPNLR